MNDPKKLVKQLIGEAPGPSPMVVTPADSAARAYAARQNAKEDEDNGDSPEVVAWNTLQKAVDENKPITLSFGPESLWKLRDFLEKPHHQRNIRNVYDVLVQGFSN